MIVVLIKHKDLTPVIMTNKIGHSMNNCNYLETNLTEYVTVVLGISPKGYKRRLE